MTSTIATLFSGGEGVGCGARQAGLRHIWGIEIDDPIAQVARDNGFDVRTTNILQANPADYEIPTVLHASPPCVNFSDANPTGLETAYDLALARATARFIEVLQPPRFTLENVWRYRKSESWAIICDTLNRCGYWFDLAHVNAANMGVPQTRKRMIVRAALGQMIPQLPAPEPWIGWYESISDLIPTLPESKFAPWQLRGLRALWETTLVDSAGYPGADGERIPVTRRAEEPANTILANHGGRGIKAFVVDGASAQGRVVQMTARCGARFQGFPDEYRLPENKALVWRVIGMAVPPLLYQRIIAQLLETQ